ncbi:Deleted in malignant brain tumors 1 protein, partial [Anas platyrhynchos]
RQLGCGMAVSVPGKAHFGQGHAPIWLDEVNCTGTEGAITECRLEPWGEHNCNHNEDASVVCSVCSLHTCCSPLCMMPLQAAVLGRYLLIYPFPSLEPTELRLVNGPNRCAGRVEVLHHQQWGSVCDNHWDMEDA